MNLDDLRKKIDPAVVEYIDLIMNSKIDQSQYSNHVKSITAHNMRSAAQHNAEEFAMNDHIHDDLYLKNTSNQHFTGNLNIIDSEPSQNFGNLKVQNQIQSSSFITNIFYSPNGAIDCNNNNLQNVKHPVNNQDAATKEYVDSQVGGAIGNHSHSADDITSGTLDGERIPSLGTPKIQDNAITPDKLDRSYLESYGDVEFQGNLTIKDTNPPEEYGNLIVEGNIIVDNDFEAGAVYTNQIGNAQTSDGTNGIIDCNNNNLQNVKHPVNNQDAATKQYVDNTIQQFGITQNETKQIRDKKDIIILGSHSFENDNVGFVPQGWFGEGQIVDSYKGMYKPYRFQKLYNKWEIGFYVFLEQKSNGIIEFWVNLAEQTVSPGLFITTRFNEIDHIMLTFNGINEGLITYSTSPSSVINIGTWKSEIWYHIRIEFNCNGGPNKIFINHRKAYEGNQCRNVVNGINVFIPICIYNDQARFCAYVSGIDFSWTQGYSINRNAGIISSHLIAQESLKYISLPPSNFNSYDFYILSNNGGYFVIEINLIDRTFKLIEGSYSGLTNNLSTNNPPMPVEIKAANLHIYCQFNTSGFTAFYTYYHPDSGPYDRHYFEPTGINGAYVRGEISALRLKNGKFYIRLNNSSGSHYTGFKLMGYWI